MRGILDNIPIQRSSIFPDLMLWTFIYDAMSCLHCFPRSGENLVSEQDVLTSKLTARNVIRTDFNTFRLFSLRV